MFTLAFQPKPENSITIAVSSRVLFNMEKEQHIYEQQGMEEYIKHQVEHETQPFCPGPAFSFVKVRVLLMRRRGRDEACGSCISTALLSFVCFNSVFCCCSQALEAVNTRLREIYPDSEELFDVVLMTNNPAYVGLRLINTINHHSEFQQYG